jgi:glycosyltransferase involved in cell wall biosynthesis
MKILLTIIKGVNMIPVIIPAKNEKDNLADTINSLKETIRYANEEPFIVVIDDGSSDNTAQIAKELGCHVVSLPDRGYSALGMPELADTHNAGYEYIDKHINKDDYEFLMVVGADTTFEKNYLQLLLNAMQNDKNLVMCAGVLNNIKTNFDAVRGSGRLIRNTFWTKVGRRSPNKYYSWESFPLVYANAYGYKTRTIYEAKMYTHREPMALVDWRNYGIQMKENGSIFPYVFLRAIKRILKNRDIKGGYRLILGYLFSSPAMYDKKLREYNSKRQWKRILKIGF